MQGTIAHKIIHEVKVALIFYWTQYLLFVLIFVLMQFIGVLFDTPKEGYAFYEVALGNIAWTLALTSASFAIGSLFYILVFVILNFIKKGIPFKINAFMWIFILVLSFLANKAPFLEKTLGVLSWGGLFFFSLWITMLYGFHRLYKDKSFLHLSEKLGF